MTVETLRTAQALVEAGLVPASDRAALDRVAARYAIAITPAMADLMTPEDQADPIARQFVPRPEELATAPEETTDPIGDAIHSPVPGIVHRYPDRVLFKPVHVCPVYCRFCFRREMVGPDGLGNLTAQETAAALAYIAADPGIWEVILSGGDPLILAPRRLRALVEPLAAIPHVKVIRVHTRVPVVSPERVTNDLATALRTDPDKAAYVVLHSNHASELTPQARAACARLIDRGIPMLSQSVLLRGVNDRPEVLEALMRAFVETRIKPYYLHHPDLAPGTAEFRLPLSEGQDLVRSLRGRVSGLCQPSYVLDLPGGHGKSPVGHNFVVPIAGAQGEPARYRVEDYRGQIHDYPPTPIRPAEGPGEPDQ